MKVPQSTRLAPLLEAARARAYWTSDLVHVPSHLAAIRRPISRSGARGRLRLFNIDLHIGVIGDFRAVTEPLGVDLTDWTISSHAGLIGRHREPVIGFNASNWRRLSPKVIDRFLRRYGRFLDQFDGFVVSYSPAFATLFTALQKPILAICATRYEVPFTARQEQWHWLDDELRRAVADGQLTFVSNNLGDQAYLRHFTGIESRHIPSLCSYTGAPYSPRSKHFAVGSKSVTCAEAIKRATDGLARAAEELLPRRATWPQRHSVRGWVHIPYNISQMSIFEQYWEGVPLYVPDDELLLALRHEDPSGVLSELSMYQVLGLPTSDLPEGDPNRVDDPEVIRWWLEKSDFGPRGELAEIVRFESFDELAELLSIQNDEAVSRRIRESNIRRRDSVVSAWTQVIESVWGRS